MEKLYRKKSNGRYEPVGYNHPDISDGIWLVQSKEGSRSFKSLLWLVGEIKEPANVVNHATLQSMSDELTTYLGKLQDPKTEEHKEAKKIMGGYFNTPQITNISRSDLITLILREIAKKL